MGMIVNPFTTVTASPNFGNVLVLAHFNGSNGATQPFTNSATATGAPTLTATTGTLDTSQSKFGTASLNTNAGIGSSMTLSMASQCNIGTGDFTFEFWLRTPVDGVARDADYGGAGSNPTPSFQIRHSTTTMLFRFNGTDRITGGTELTAATWHAIAVSRVSGTTRMYVDGTQVGSNYTDGNTYTGTSKPLYLGRDENGNAGTQRWYDEWRMTVGVGRYSGASYVVDTVEFPNS
jgi:hypothetical protein